MPRPYTQMRLSTASLAELTKQCICVVKNTQRCPRVRANDFGQQETQAMKERYHELVQSLVQHYTMLTEDKRDEYAGELAASRVCRACLNAGKAQEVKVEMLRQRAEEEGRKACSAERADVEMSDGEASTQIPMRQGASYKQIGLVQSRQPSTTTLLWHEFQSLDLRSPELPADRNATGRRASDSTQPMQRQRSSRTKVQSRKARAASQHRPENPPKSRPFNQQTKRSRQNAQPASSEHRITKRKGRMPDQMDQFGTEDLRRELARRARLALSDDTVLLLDANSREPCDFWKLLTALMPLSHDNAEKPLCDSRSSKERRRMPGSVAAERVWSHSIEMKL